MSVRLFYLLLKIIVLDSFEQQPWNLSFISILKSFRSSNLLHILGFKFMGYHGSGEGFKPIEITKSDVSANISRVMQYFVYIMSKLYK